MLRSWQFVETVLGIIFRHPIAGTSVIPILPDGRLVLVRRQDNGKWAIPGGMVNWGEDLPTSAKRELAEETGLELLEITRLVGVYSHPLRDPRIHSICVAIVAQVEGKITVQDKLEIAEARAFDPQNLPLGQMSHDHARQLEDYLQGRITIA